MTQALDTTHDDRGDEPPGPEEARSDARRPSAKVAAVPALIALAIFVGGIGVLGYPAELMLVLAGVLFAGFAVARGARFEQVVTGMGEKIKQALPAILILFMIGVIIGSWMAAGTIPLLVSYGLRVIDPSFLYVLAFATTAVVSTFTGTSWGSAGTIGVALMGVAAAMDVSLAVTAGAVVSGAYFGDKMSPLSDTTNMSAIAAGANLYEHIRHMLYTTIPASVLAVVVYLLVGRSLGGSDAQLGDVEAILTELDTSFVLTPWLLLPPLVVLAGSILRKPPLVVLFASSTVAVVLALIVQGSSLGTVLAATTSGFTTDMLPTGGEASDALTTLVERGGLYSMYTATFFVFAAFFFASGLEASKVLRSLLEPVVSRLRSTGGVVVTTLVSGFAIVSATSNALITYFLVRDLFGGAFARRRLHPVNLSRSMEDSATLTEVLMPWTVSGVFIATTLGVGNFEFLPWAVTNWAGFLFSAFIAVLAPVTGGFGIRRLGDADAHAHRQTTEDARA
ncbi:Na+/H+ antiporter NhaC [Pseudokineococcus sp. 5B2Z-1]|uniref:Na+/H+ antiporter NhaC n=1 Tax=Pseudokineococcus sp. 5B2Z-1 TaxID=3132744 RepID=UPI0030967892